MESNLCARTSCWSRCFYFYFLYCCLKQACPRPLLGWTRRSIWANITFNYPRWETRSLAFSRSHTRAHSFLYFTFIPLHLNTASLWTFSYRSELLLPIALRELIHYVWHRSENKRSTCLPPLLLSVTPGDVVYLVYVLAQVPGLGTWLLFPLARIKSEASDVGTVRSHVIRLMYYTPSNCQSAVNLAKTGKKKHKERRGC